MNIPEILATIGEIGFVDIRKDGSICITPPAINVHSHRLEVFSRIMFEYKKIHPASSFKGFFTLYDAWREHAEPSVCPEYTAVKKRILRMYAGKGTLGEPGRFIQPFFLRDLFPVFTYPVLAFGRHKNDPFVQLLPDPEFIETEGYYGLCAEIDSDDISWQEKLPKLFWRGSMHGFPYKSYDPMQLRCQRSILLNWNRHHDDICDAAIDKKASKKEQLRYKYLLDVDGEVNAWSGLFWKLYCNSVVFKVSSHYEQWYYARLKPWVHFIPVSGDLSDLEEKFCWALAHDEVCSQIAQSGKEFASSLTVQGEFCQLDLADNTGDLFRRYDVTTTAICHIPQLSELTVIHTYQPSCATVSQPPGFGDFLRGTITLHQLSNKYGFNLCLDLRSHSLHHFVRNHDNVAERDDCPVHEFFNQKNCELESFLVGQSTLRTIWVTTHAVPQQPITRQCRSYLLKRLKPTKEISDYIADISTDLRLDAFCTVHIRMGDHQFDSEITLPPMMEYWFTDEVLPVWGKEVLVISDNVSIKKALKKRFDVKIIDVKPVHLGQSMSCAKPIVEVRDTFAEFLLMGRSSWIYQYSVYPWGSSFSEMCAQIYDIPFEKMSDNAFQGT